jgi:hypothetical protein
MADEPKPLTRKQRMFVEHYLTVWNSVRAAEAAGYKWPTRQGPRNLQRSDIAAAIEDRLTRAAMSADEVLARLTQQATVNIADFIEEAEVTKIDEHGLSVTVTVFGLNWKALQERGFLVKKISNTANGVSIELHDGQTALIKLGEKHKLFAGRLELSGPDGKPIEVADVRRHILSRLAEAADQEHPTDLPEQSV